MIRKVPEPVRQAAAGRSTEQKEGTGDQLLVADTLGMTFSRFRRQFCQI